VTTSSNCWDASDLGACPNFPGQTIVTNPLDFFEDEGELKVDRTPLTMDNRAMGSIEQARQEVQTAFAKALEVADKGQMQPLAAVETSLWSVLLALGRALIALYLARQGGSSGFPLQVHETRGCILARPERCVLGVRDRLNTGALRRRAACEASADQSARRKRRRHASKDIMPARSDAFPFGAAYPPSE
jgi:hypothetical protein